MTNKPQLSMTLGSFAAAEPDSWGHLVDVAQAAEAEGFDRLVLPDHVVFGENLEAYSRPELGGVVGGAQPTGPDGHWLEPLTTIAYLAGMTSSIRFGTNILLAALRRPIVLAKMATTIDVLSHGRLDLGVGVGWQREEYAAAGLDFDDRGRQLDHTLDVCQTIWNGERVDFADDRLEFSGIHQMPKPVNPGGVPIWVSGTVNPRSMRRLARYGAGWIPWGDDATDLPAAISRMRDAVEAEGRDPSGIQVVGSLPLHRNADAEIDLPATVRCVPELAEAGVTDFRFGLLVRADGPDPAELLGSINAEFRAAVS